MGLIGLVIRTVIIVAGTVYAADYVTMPVDNTYELTYPPENLIQYIKDNL